MNVATATEIPLCHHSPKKHDLARKKHLAEEVSTEFVSLDPALVFTSTMTPDENYSLADLASICNSTRGDQRIFSYRHNDKSSTVAEETCQAPTCCAFCFKTPTKSDRCQI